MKHIKYVDIEELPKIIVGLKIAAVLTKCFNEKLYKKMLKELKNTEFRLKCKNNTNQ